MPIASDDGVVDKLALGSSEADADPLSGLSKRPNMPFAGYYAEGAASPYQVAFQSTAQNFLAQRTPGESAAGYVKRRLEHPRQPEDLRKDVDALINEGLEIGYADLRKRVSLTAKSSLRKNKGVAAFFRRKRD